jgi:hypothetical protein
MLKKALSLTMLLLVGMFSFGAVAAQEVTPEATPEINLENVTANHESFYGQEVSLTGEIEEFVNPRVFVLGEGAALDDDKVLVINNSDNEWYLWIHKGLNVTVTGVVYPSINQGGLEQIASGNPGMMPTTDASAPGLTEATLEPDLSMGTGATEAVMPDMSATQDMGLMMTEEAMTPMADMNATQDMGLMATPMATEATSMSSGDMAATQDMRMMPTQDTTMSSGDMAATQDMSMTTPMPTQDSNLLATATPEPTVTRPDFASMNLPDEYLDYTIIVVGSVDDIVYNETGE